MGSQPAPKRGSFNIGAHFLTHIERWAEEKVKAGKAKYGTFLETWNGRDPHVDVREELLDALQYNEQAKKEREDLILQVNNLIATNKGILAERDEFKVDAERLRKLNLELAQKNEQAREQHAKEIFDLGRETSRLADECASLRECNNTFPVALDKLEKFKAYVHKRLDDAGVPADPPSPHREAGCRIGGRLDIVLAALARLEDENRKLKTLVEDQRGMDARVNEAMLTAEAKEKELSQALGEAHVEINKLQDRLHVAQVAQQSLAYTLAEYQEDVLRTARALTADKAMFTFTLGLAGEAGEVADLIKKHIGHDHPLDEAKLIKELGDVLWYIAALADHFHISLGKIARANIEKLKARYPDGFSTERSLNRKDTDHSENDE